LSEDEGLIAGWSLAEELSKSSVENESPRGEHIIVGEGNVDLSVVMQVNARQEVRQWDCIMQWTDEVVTDQLELDDWWFGRILVLVQDERHFGRAVSCLSMRRMGLTHFVLINTEPFYNQFNSIASNFIVFA
jgi:hypothetical protein